MALHARFAQRESTHQTRGQKIAMLALETRSTQKKVKHRLMIVNHAAQGLLRQRVARLKILASVVIDSTRPQTGPAWTALLALYAKIFLAHLDLQLISSSWMLRA